MADKHAGSMGREMTRYLLVGLLCALQISTSLSFVSIAASQPLEPSAAEKGGFSLIGDTPDEYLLSLVGRHQDEVIAYLGRPDSTSSRYGSTGIFITDLSYKRYNFYLLCNDNLVIQFMISHSSKEEYYRRNLKGGAVLGMTRSEIESRIGPGQRQTNYFYSWFDMTVIVHYTNVVPGREFSIRYYGRNATDMAAKGETVWIDRLKE
jgi:hypothetical protein